MSKRIRFCLAFRVIPAFDQIIMLSNKSGISLSFLAALLEDVPYHNKGIEFTFGPEIVIVLIKMIQNVLVNQGKHPEDVCIQISL